MGQFGDTAKPVIQRYFYNMVYIIAYKDFYADIVKEVKVQDEMLMRRMMK